MKFSTSVLAIASAFSLAAAQNSTANYECLTTSKLRALIPACALVCQAKAIAATDCAYEDVRCNCIKTGKVQQVIEPCLADPAFSNCTSAEVKAFANIVVPVCTQLNATTPAAIAAACASPSSSTTLYTATGTVYPSGWAKPTAWTTAPIPFTGGATKLASGISAVGAAVAAVLLL